MRLWYVIALVLLALGVAGLASYPLTPHPDPTFVTVRLDGSATAPGVVEVAHPGPHAIWATAASGPDGDRCRVTSPGGGAVAVAAIAVAVVAFVRTRRAVGRRSQPDGVTG